MATFTISCLLRNKITVTVLERRRRVLKETFSPLISAENKKISQFSLASFHSTSHLWLSIITQIYSLKLTLSVQNTLNIV